MHADIPEDDMTLKIVAVLPEGGEASKNDKYVNCVENAWFAGVGQGAEGRACSHSQQG